MLQPIEILEVECVRCIHCGAVVAACQKATTCLVAAQRVRARRQGHQPVNEHMLSRVGVFEALELLGSWESLAVVTPTPERRQCDRICSRQRQGLFLFRLEKLPVKELLRRLAPPEYLPVHQWKVICYVRPPL